MEKKSLWIILLTPSTPADAFDSARSFSLEALCHTQQELGTFTEYFESYMPEDPLLTLSFLVGLTLFCPCVTIYLSQKKGR